MIQGFGVCLTIRVSLSDMFGKARAFNVSKYSRSRFDCLTNINRTTENRLLIDLCMLRESYERREISEVFWIPTHLRRTRAWSHHYARPFKSSWKQKTCNYQKCMRGAIQATLDLRPSREFKSPPSVGSHVRLNATLTCPNLITSRFTVILHLIRVSLDGCKPPTRTVKLREPTPVVLLYIWGISPDSLPSIAKNK